MTEQEFKEFRRNCLMCARDPHDLSFEPTLYCMLDTADMHRKCCVENCPKLKVAGIESEKETIKLDRGVTAHTIHKIIDDAMEKKDRRVNIFMSEIGVTINVEPLVEHKPHWIPLRYKRGNLIYKCSECNIVNRDLVPFCPYCGEKLTCPSEEEVNTLTNHQDASDFESLRGYLTKEDSADEMPEV